MSNVFSPVYMLIFSNKLWLLSFMYFFHFFSQFRWKLLKRKKDLQSIFLYVYLHGALKSLSKQRMDREKANEARKNSAATTQQRHTFKWMDWIKKERRETGKMIHYINIIMYVSYDHRFALRFFDVVVFYRWFTLLSFFALRKNPFSVVRHNEFVFFL